MNKVVSTIGKAGVRNSISVSQFLNIRHSQNSILTVEISKQPSTLLKNSLWIGYRNGGMASWLSSLMPHLPQKQFCIYMDEDSYKGSEYMYSYYSEYFSKLFHKQYLGTCVYPRRLLNQKEMTLFNEIKANQMQKHLLSNDSSQRTVLLDLRGSEMAIKDSMSNAVRNYQNTNYINLPLNDQDLIDTLTQKTLHLPKKTQLITLCAKGYRSLIGYTLLQHLKKPQWKVKLCRSPIAEVKQNLLKPIKVQNTESFSNFAFS